MFVSIPNCSQWLGYLFNIRFAECTTTIDNASTLALSNHANVRQTAQRRWELKYSVRYKCKSVGKILICRRLQWKNLVFPYTAARQVPRCSSRKLQPSIHFPSLHMFTSDCTKVRNATVFQKSRHHLKIPDARQMTYFKPIKIRRHCTIRRRPHRCVYPSLSTECRSCTPQLERRT